MYVCIYIYIYKERKREIAWGCLGTESSLMEEEMMRGVKSIFRFEWRKIKKRTFLWLHWGSITRSGEQIEDIFYGFLCTINDCREGVSETNWGLWGGKWKLKSGFQWSCVVRNERKEDTLFPPCLFASDKPHGLKANNIHKAKKPVLITSCVVLNANTSLKMGGRNSWWGVCSARVKI